MIRNLLLRILLHCTFFGFWKKEKYGLSGPGIPGTLTRIGFLGRHNPARVREEGKEGRGAREVVGGVFPSWPQLHRHTGLTQCGQPRTPPPSVAEYVKRLVLLGIQWWNTNSPALWSCVIIPLRKLLGRSASAGSGRLSKEAGMKPSLPELAYDTFSAVRERGSSPRGKQPRPEGAEAQGPQQERALGLAHQRFCKRSGSLAP